MLSADIHWQFCLDGYNTHYNDSDADEIRQWCEDGTLLIAFQRRGNEHYVSGSDVFDWVPLSDDPVEIDFDMQYPGTLID